MRYLQPPKTSPTKLMAGGVHTRTDGELTITLTVQDVGAEIIWTVTVVGSDGGQTYSDFLLLDGYREKGVNSGNFNLYSPTFTGSPVAYYANNIVGFSSDWNPDGSGTQVDSGSWSA
jgi:hypothetical protein